MVASEVRTAAAAVRSAAFLRPVDLAQLGLSRYRVAALVANGSLVRTRNGRYLRPEVHPALITASRYGGRLDCTSLAAAMGIFVRESRSLHVQLTPATTRLPPRPAHVVAHWRQSRAGRCDLAADLIEALAQACRCQRPRDAVATLDSAWHHGLVDESDIAEIFRRLPRRFRPVRRLLDRRSESGAETIMRLLLRGLGCSVEVQVAVTGVGRVDLIVDGWLIVECDSKAFHEGWEAQLRDRRRDMAAAALGYTTVRPVAEDIYYRPDEVLATMRAVVSHGPRAAKPLQNSTEPKPIPT